MSTSQIRHPRWPAGTPQAHHLCRALAFHSGVARQSGADLVLCNRSKWNYVLTILSFCCSDADVAILFVEESISRNPHLRYHTTRSFTKLFSSLFPVSLPFPRECIRNY